MPPKAPPLDNLDSLDKPDRENIAGSLHQLAEPVGSLQLLEGNPRRGDTHAVAASLEQFGQRKPIVARRSDRTVIAGNHTLQAARSLGWSEYAVVWVDDDDLTSKAFALADNRTAELGTYDDEQLAAMLAAVQEGDAALFAATAWTTSDLVELLAAQTPPVAFSGDPDDVPDTAPAVTAPGDLWHLGAHRLMCGDATSASDVDRLIGNRPVGCILTDPPYGIDLDTDYSHFGSGVSASVPEGQVARTYRAVGGDDQPFDAGPVRALFAGVREQFWFGGDYYRRTLSGSDLDGAFLVWDKRKEGADDFAGSGFELVWSAQPHQRLVLRHFWFGMFGTPEARQRFHPTQKPVALLADIMRRWAPETGAVLDLFAGAGSVMAACEQEGRVSFSMEIDPAYCDVICRRYQELTGTKPARDGEPYDFTEPA